MVWDQPFRPCLSSVLQVFYLKAESIRKDMDTNTVSIVGAGALGRALALRLRQKNVVLSAVVSQNIVSARNLAKKVGCLYYGTDIGIVYSSSIIIVTVPDREIEKTVRQLYEINFSSREVHIVHTSGSISVGKSMIRKKAFACFTASMHPMQSFPSKIKWTKQTLDNHFGNIYFGIEGHPKSVSLIKRMIKRIGSSAWIIPSNKKAVYHLGGVISSNFTIALLFMAVRLYKEMGLSEKQTLKILGPILHQTIHNAESLGVSMALTGPAARNDRVTIAHHRKILIRHGRHFQRMYDDLTRLCRLIAEQRELRKKNS